MQDALAQLESTYITLQPQIGMLRAACHTQEDRDAVTKQFLDARDAYWSCVNKAFHDDDPIVIALTSQLKDANDDLKTAVTKLDDIKSTIDTITQAVTIAASLASKVIPV